MRRGMTVFLLLLGGFFLGAAFITGGERLGPTWLLGVLFAVTVAIAFVAELLPEDLPARVLARTAAKLQAASRRLDERGERR